MDMDFLFGSRRKASPPSKPLTQKEFRALMHRMSQSSLYRSLMCADFHGTVPKDPARATPEQLTEYLSQHENKEGIIGGHVAWELPEQDRAWYIRQIIAMLGPEEASVVLFDEAQKMQSGCDLALRVQNIVLRLLERIRNTNEDRCQQLAQILLSKLGRKNNSALAEQLRNIVLEITEFSAQRKLGM